MMMLIMMKSHSLTAAHYLRRTQPFQGLPFPFFLQSGKMPEQRRGKRGWM